MSERNESESFREPSEHSPLLRPEQPQPEHSESASPSSDEASQQRRSKGWYAWRIFWLLVLAVVIAVFVKGWIDADETDVLNFHSRAHSP